MQRTKYSIWRVPSWLLVLLGYLVLGLAMTWPLVLRITSNLPGDAHKDGLEDAYQNVWNLWWTVEALRRPTNLWVTDMLFHPDGPNLLFHTLSPINTFMAAPVTALWGPIAGFNAVVLASFALGGLGMWLLARRRCGPGPALLAGVVYVASPFHLASLVFDGQLQIFALQWLPWYIHFFLLALWPQAAPPDQPPLARAQHGGGGILPLRTLFTRLELRAALLAGFFLTLTAWGDWYYTLFLLMFSAAALAWRLWTLRGAYARALPAPLLTIAAVFTLGAGPLIGPMLIEAARGGYVSILPSDEPGRLSADLLAYLVPQRIHPIWGAAPWAWGVDYSVNRRFYLGLSVSALAALALWHRPAARPWGLTALGFAILSLGPSLRINGVDTGLVLPYRLIADLPIVQLTRQPDRFNVLVTIALGMLAAHGAAVLLQRFATSPQRTTQPGLAPSSLASAVPRWLTLALLGGLILLEYWSSPIVTRTPPVPPFYAALPAGPGALIEYPFHPLVTYRDAERMRFQTIHERPISGGYHSRAHPQPQLGLPVLRDLQAGRLSSDIALEPGGWPAALSTLGYSHIVGYKQRPLGPVNLQPADEAPFRALVEAGLGLNAPLAEDDWLIVYAVPEASTAPVVQIRTGWGPVEELAPGVRHRWMPASAELGLISLQAGAHWLSFTATPADGPRTLRLAFEGRQFTLPLASAQRRYHLLLPLSDGPNVVRLSSLEATTSGQALYGNGDLRPISVRFERIGLTALANP
jgi:hypothetical protein